MGSLQPLQRFGSGLDNELICCFSSWILDVDKFLVPARDYSTAHAALRGPACSLTLLCCIVLELLLSVMGILQHWAVQS